MNGIGYRTELRRDKVQCIRCGSWNSKWRGECWKCKEQL